MLLLFFSCYVVSDFCNSMDCSLPGSSIHGISQARILEWIAISFLQGIFLTQGRRDSYLFRILHWQVDSLPLAPPGKTQISGSYGNSMLKFFRTHQTIFHSSYTIYILNSNLSFPISSPLFLFFDNSHPEGCEVVSHCDFELLFPKDWWSLGEHPFMCLWAICI